MSTIGNVAKTAGKVLSTASKIKKGINNAKTKKKEELAQVRSGQVAKDNAIVSPTFNQNTAKTQNNLSTLGKTVSTFMEANKAKNTGGKKDITITNTHVDPNAVNTPEVNQEETPVTTPVTTTATANAGTTTSTTGNTTTEETPTNDTPFAGQPGANETTTGFGADTGYTGPIEENILGDTSKSTEFDTTTSEETPDTEATTDETTAEEEANKATTEDTTTTKTIADEVIEEETSDRTLKAKYGYNPSTLNNDLNLMRTSGFSSMTTGQIGNVAKACALGGLSAKDAMDYMTKMAVIPNSIKQQIYDECGLTELEKEFIENPSLTEQNLYNAYYEEMGLGKIKEDIAGLTRERDKEISKYNENPFLPKYARNNYTNNITAQYNNQIEALQTEYKNGIDQINEKIQGYMKYGMQKLEYMQKKAEDYIDGIKPTYESAMLSLFMPEYDAYKTVQADKDLAEEYAKNGNLTEVTGLMTDAQLINAVANSAVIKSADGRTWINTSSMPSFIQTNRDEFGNVSTTSKLNWLTGNYDTNLYNAGMSAISGYNGTPTASTYSGHVINTGNGQTYDDSKWATDPNHTAAVSQRTNAIKGYNGDYETYFNNKYGKSIYSNNDIISAAAEAGIDPDLLAGMIDVESYGGSSPVGVNNNNPAGLSARADGTVPEWIQAMGGSLGTNRPANEGGRYITFDTAQNGLRATAKLIAYYSNGQLANQASQTGGDDYNVYTYIVSNNSNLRGLSQNEFEKAKEKALSGENLSAEAKTESERRTQEAALDYLRYMSDNGIKIKPSGDLEEEYRILREITEPGKYTEREIRASWDAVAGNAALGKFTPGANWELVSKIRAIMNGLSDQAMLDALIDAKSRNAVFGQLSDNEGKTIKNSSTFAKVTGWDSKKQNTPNSPESTREFMIRYTNRMADKYDFGGENPTAKSDVDVINSLIK